MEKMDVNLWFGLTYASWLTVPRIVMEAMPLDWQYKFTELLNEMNETFDWCPDDITFNVTARRNGKFANVPLLLNDYRRGSIEHLRIKSPAAEIKVGTANNTQQTLPAAPGVPGLAQGHIENVG